MSNNLACSKRPAVPSDWLVEVNLEWLSLSLRVDK